MDLALLDHDLQEIFEPVRVRLLESLDLIAEGLVIPSCEFTVSGFKARTRKEFLEIIVSSYYIGDFGFQVREDIREQMSNDFIELRTCLQSKTSMLIYFSEHLSERDYYGNWRNKFKRRTRRIQFLFKYQKLPKRQQRRRGYNDHGTMIPETQWKPKHDWSLDQLQRQIEEDRKQFEALLELTIGFYT